MSKVNTHKALFYCESCGSEVPQNAKFCNTCGKFFTFVRCPKCQFTGDSKKFTNGCPKCGYALKKTDTRQGIGHKKSSGFTWNRSRNNKEGTEDSSLPVWIYIVTILALIAVVFGVYSCL